jgi:hypothetical protein
MVFEPAPVDEINGPVRQSGPDERRNVVDHQSKAFLGRSQALKVCGFTVPLVPTRTPHALNLAERRRFTNSTHAPNLWADSAKRLKRDTDSGRSSVGAPLVPAPSPPSAELVPAGHPQGLPRRQRWPLALGALVALIAALGLVWFATHRAPPPRTEPKPRRLTANPAGNPATDAHISPDGKYLAYADQAGIQLQLIDTGETRTIPQPQGLEYKVTGWSPGSAPSQLRRVPLSGGPSQLARSRSMA